ncbi:MAG: type II toxin-antitoxin system HicA family toxin [Prevotellaceae bacterium]|nr:type II toxin-antitoxin system HicA family toxin [Prevotellaceae bacterium]
MKWNEVLRMAEDRGYRFFRHCKKHDAYVHPDKKDVLYLERHWGQEVKRGLLNQLKKQIGF